MAKNKLEKPNNCQVCGTTAELVKTESQAFVRCSNCARRGQAVCHSEPNESMSPEDFMQMAINSWNDCQRLMEVGERFLSFVCEPQGRECIKQAFKHNSFAESGWWDRDPVYELMLDLNELIGGGQSE